MKQQKSNAWRLPVNYVIPIFSNPIVRFFSLAAAALLIIVIAIAPLTSAVVEGWSRRDVELRARLIFRSIRDQLTSGVADGASLVSLFERLSGDERVLALGLCTSAGELQHITKQMPHDVKCEDLPRAATDKFATLSASSGRIHVSVFPLTGGKDSSHLLVLHDLSYVSERTREAYAYALLALFGVAIGFGLLLVAFIIVLNRSWTRSISGAMRTINSGRDEGSLQTPELPIGKELRALLTDFRVERSLNEEIRVDWSPKTLQRLLKEELPGSEVIVVSNREPYIHNDEDGHVVLQTPASGLVAALEPVMRACGGTWIAHGSGSADRGTVDDHDRIRVPPGEAAYTLRRVWISEEEQDGYYFGLANEGLWPLCHIAFVRPTFRQADWNTYRVINQRFADAVVEEAAQENPVVLVQDYHFALLPRMIRQRLPKATVVTFWHIPWPNSETFGICPWRQEIVDGLLGSSILGFHTQFHCNNFLEAADRFMESRIDRELGSVALGGHETLIRPYPISIEWPPAALASQAPVAECREAVRRKHGLASDVRIAIGIERFDYTKGILDRLRAIDDLLSRQPEWRGTLVFIQAAAPTRSKLDVYSNLQTEAMRLAEEINARHGSPEYKPVFLIIRHHQPQEVFELFRAADVCVVSSLHDGMNLVAKEFVASRDDEQGVLVLSGFTGASRELSEALIINPYDTTGMADVIGSALRMSAADQRERMKFMRESIQQRNVYRWAAQMLFDAARVRRRGQILATSS